MCMRLVRVHAGASGRGITSRVRHMNDASGRKAQHIGTARYGVARGDRSASIEAWSAEIETTRSDPSLAQEHATALEDHQRAERANAHTAIQTAPVRALASTLSTTRWTRTPSANVAKAGGRSAW